MKIQSIIFLFFLTTLLSCSFGKKIKTGEQAFERKQYSVAIDLLIDEYEGTSSLKNQARKAYLLGECYKYLKDDKESLYWYEVADKQNYGVEALRELAYAYKSNGKYSQAVKAFEKLNNELGNRSEIRREIAICGEAIRWIKENDKEYEVSRSYANSAQADYSPVIYEDDYIVFTSDRGGSTGDGRYNWTGNKFSDFYLMSKNGAAIQPFDPIINSEHNEGTIAFSKDYNELFFTRCYSESTEDAYCKVMYSDRYDGYWTEPIALPFNKPGMNYGHPTLIENDSVLIYTAKIDNTVSDYDLFYVIREVDGAWSEPQRMPDVLNTKGNEKFPTGHGDTLFFSSDHHPGLGGLDIFMTYLDKNRKWVRPIRMPVPINSPADDFSFVVDKKSTRNGDVLETGFFSSSRTGIGDDDIYTYKKVVVEKTDKEVPEVVIDEPVVERNISYYIAGKVVEPIYEENNNPNTNIIGYRPVDFARVRINQDSSIIGTFTTDRTGVFIEELESESDYNIYAGKNRYLNNSMDVTTRNITIDSAQDVVTLNVQLVINRVFKGKEINLSDIYYDLDKDFIREDAKPTLDKLVKILTDNPDIRLQLSSHTDCRAEDQYNIDLSQRRAISAVKYIISKGVIQKRLVPKGYGETQLAVDCECEKCTEEEHQTNRRTTFKIIS